jgi:hypothetical protein
MNNEKMPIIINQLQICGKNVDSKTICSYIQTGLSILIGKRSVMQKNIWQQSHDDILLTSSSGASSILL